MSGSSGCGRKVKSSAGVGSGVEVGIGVFVGVGSGVGVGFGVFVGVKEGNKVFCGAVVVMPWVKSWSGLSAFFPHEEKRMQEARSVQHTFLVLDLNVRGAFSLCPVFVFIRYLSLF